MPKTQAGNRSQRDPAEQPSPQGDSFTPPAISVPKGGGAIRGIDEKFSVNPATGTASLSIPIATSPGRSGFGPQLSLSYNSGAGNGPFGLGWSLSAPNITRKTDKGLPRYQDAEASDVFILSGAEDLVPVYRKDPDGDWIKDHPEYRLDDEFWVRNEEGDLVIHEDEKDDYLVRRYRPRIEGLFARIERWTKIGDASDVHWRSVSKDNILTIYGKSAESRIFDPHNPQRIFSWLISETRDDKGNAVIYQYQKEDGEGVDLSQAHERNRGDRDDTRRKTNRYLKRILYGNRTPLLDGDGKRYRSLTPAQINSAGWMFEVVFDYGEGHYADEEAVDEGCVFANAQLDPSADTHWPPRKDPFSSYRAGFEVRTYRLCRRVLMFHHFPSELDQKDILVRATEFTYTEGPVASFITEVIQSGYVHAPKGAETNRYLKKSLPPVEFEYSPVLTPEALARQPVVEVDAGSLENLPYGLDGKAYQWTDLDGEGISGILTEQGGAWYYKPNLSPTNLQLHDDGERVVARFGPTQQVATKPAATLAGGAQFMDLAGDGQLDLVQLSGPTRGFYERTHDADWESLRSFVSLPNVNPGDSNLRFIDLNGDGHADMLLTEDNIFTWYPSLGEEGFGPAERVHQALDEEEGPRLVFADSTQSIYLADFSGDGLIDLARVRNGEVCYWPNLGYGYFGAKVAMDNAPWFDAPDQFNQQRVRLTDIDGSGTTDIVYLHYEGADIYFNEAGNRWRQRETLPKFPPVDNLASVQVLDLLGNGTACLVWSSPLPSNGQRPMRYIDLMDGQKPHLLVKVANNLGAETHIHYAPSTKLYLEDKEAGTPWITRIPFPVQVVERVETHDRISRNRFVTRYSYHHGYFDGQEREFRGFGRVDQWDTAEYASLEADSRLAESTNFDAASHMPPVLTKTWFHTGIYMGRAQVSNFFAGLLNAQDQGEYYREPAWPAANQDGDAEAKMHLLPDTVLPQDLTAEEAREACRALKGAMLRQEVYALDGTDKEDHPYTVTEQNFSIKRLQERATNHHGVFFTHAREALSYHYERNPQDPRVSHALTLEVDDFGNVLKQVAIGYGRRKTIHVVNEQGQVEEKPNPGLSELDAKDQKKQTGRLVTYTENVVTNAINAEDDYRAPLPCETQTYELRQIASVGGQTTRLMFDDVLAAVAQAGIEGHDINYEDLDFEGAKNAIATHPEWRAHYFRRLIEHVRTRYRPNDLGKSLSNDPSTLLELGALESLALPGESYTLAFTDSLLKQVFKRGDDHLLHPNPGNVLSGQGPDQGGYVDLESDGNWWVPSGRVFYHSGSDATASDELEKAREHFFLPRRFRDPFGHDTIVDYDTNALLTVRTQDALENEVHAQHNYRMLQPWCVTDPNGNRTQVKFDALGLVVGTAVMGKTGEEVGDSFAEFKTDLEEAEILDHLNNPLNDPHVILGTATTRLVYDLFGYYRTRGTDEPQPAVVYTLVRETHVSDLNYAAGDRSKVQHSFVYSDGFGREIQKKIQAEPEEPGGPLRWVGSGWTVFNNKGKPVRQYEPFFSRLLEKRHCFEFGVKVGVSPVLFYDPVGRVICTLHPNHTYEKVVFDPWQQTTYDVNDTVTLFPQSDDDVRKFFVNEDASSDAESSDADEAFCDDYGGMPRIPQADFLPTWHALRTDDAFASKFAERYPDAADRTNEKSAAEKAAAHANTPTVAHFDVLGRPFLTVAHNKVVCPGHKLDGKEDFFRTRVELDIEGNQREVRDERKNDQGILEERVVMRYDYAIVGPSQDENDAASNRIHQASMEAGERWTLNDVTGKPIRAWDSRGHNFTTAYDALRRPEQRFVQGTDDTSFQPDPRTVWDDPLLIEKIEYGEGQPDDKDLNLRTRVFRHCDSAGVITNMAVHPLTGETEAYDFKGNLLRSLRKLTKHYREIPNWAGDPDLLAEEETFVSSTTYDALNRPIQIIAPHSSQDGTKLNVIQPVYNEANLLERIDVWLEQAAESGEVLDRDDRPPSAVGVDNIDYDAKGQRILIAYRVKDDNDADKLVQTEYSYDPETFRLTHLITKRPDNLAADKRRVQDLHYTYDPVGNITHIRDEAQQTIYFSNKRVEPSAEYTYDAVYRLIEAAGREHLGQVGNAPIPHSYNDAKRIQQSHPNSGEAMGTYTERYVYDAVGNFLEMRHIGNNPANDGWTRSYVYEEKSLLESGLMSNRLTSTTVGSHEPEQYSTDADGYDAHGNMLRMPQLAVMQWDYQDQLQMTQRQKVNDEDAEGIERHGERTYYVYDANGQRVRKVTEKDGEPKEERIYLGGFEVYRKYAGSDVELERETLHIMDDKQRIALVETRIIGNDLGAQQLIRYQLGNHLGSACLELDEVARIISYEEYTPYGSTAYQAVRSGTDVPRKRYRYTGKERDEESGLYYHGTRYYAAWLGRWMSCDKLLFVDGLNLYLYVTNNPILHLDRDGQQSGTHPLEEGLGKRFLDLADDETVSSIIEVGIVVNDKTELSRILHSLSEQIHMDITAGEEATTAKELLSQLSELQNISLPKLEADWKKVVQLHKEASPRKTADHIECLPQESQHWGSIDQLRFGKIVGEGLDIDPMLAILLSPTGGMVGPGYSPGSHDYLSHEILRIHGGVHDAAGYMYNFHGIGPGYQYVPDTWETLDTSNPLAGQVSGISFWTVEMAKRGLLSEPKPTLTLRDLTRTRMAFYAGYKFGQVVNRELLPDSLQEAIGGTITETLEHGSRNVRDFWFGQ